MWKQTYTTFEGLHNKRRKNTLPAMCWRGERMRRARRAACLLAVALVSVAFLISAAYTTAEWETAVIYPLPSQWAAAVTGSPQPTTKPSATPTPKPAPEVYKPDETEVEMLARMLWGEARGVPSDMEKAACVWCVLNRIDDESGLWPDTVAEVLTQRNQFAGYSPDHPTTEELKAIAADVLIRWEREKRTGGDVGRVLPVEYTYFTGDGKNNHFRTEYRGGAVWDWSLTNPYEN